MIHVALGYIFVKNDLSQTVKGEVSHPCEKIHVFLRILFWLWRTIKLYRSKTIYPFSIPDVIVIVILRNKLQNLIYLKRI